MLRVEQVVQDIKEWKDIYNVLKQVKKETLIKLCQERNIPRKKYTKLELALCIHHSTNGNHQPPHEPEILLMNTLQTVRGMNNVFSLLQSIKKERLLILCKDFNIPHRTHWTKYKLFEQIRMTHNPE
jgi:hypothetical protein